ARCGKIADDVVTGVPLPYKIRDDGQATDRQFQALVKTVLRDGRLIRPRELLREPIGVGWDTAAMEFAQPAHAVVVKMRGNDTGDAAVQAAFDPLDERGRKAVRGRRIKNDRFIAGNDDHAVAWH